MSANAIQGSVYGRGTRSVDYLGSTERDFCDVPLENYDLIVVEPGETPRDEVLRRLAFGAATGTDVVWLGLALSPPPDDWRVVGCFRGATIYERREDR